MENKKQNPIYYLSRGISEFAQKYLPDAYILALIISLVVFVSGILFTRQTPFQMILHFHNNMWSLLAFSMQSVVMVVFSTVCAGTEPVSP